jgi:hypothetical protein
MRAAWAHYYAAWKAAVGRPRAANLRYLCPRRARSKTPRPLTARRIMRSPPSRAATGASRVENESARHPGPSRHRRPAPGLEAAPCPSPPVRASHTAGPERFSCGGGSTTRRCVARAIAPGGGDETGASRDLARAAWERSHRASCGRPSTASPAERGAVPCWKFERVRGVSLDASLLYTLQNAICRAHGTLVSSPTASGT